MYLAGGAFQIHASTVSRMWQLVNNSLSFMSMLICLINTKPSCCFFSIHVTARLAKIIVRILAGLYIHSEEHIQIINFSGL